MLIAGPNLTTDRTVTIDELRPGEVLRFATATITPGGKGVNVARVSRAMGFPAVLMAMVPGRTGRAGGKPARLGAGTRPAVRPGGGRVGQ